MRRARRVGTDALRQSVLPEELHEDRAHALERDIEPTLAGEYEA
jgi:hypothetical protein